MNCWKFNPNYSRLSCIKNEVTYLIHWDWLRVRPSSNRCTCGHWFSKCVVASAKWLIKQTKRTVPWHFPRESGEITSPHLYLQYTQVKNMSSKCWWCAVIYHANESRSVINVGWFTRAYMLFRVPVCVHVSWYMLEIVIAWDVLWSVSRGSKLTQMWCGQFHIPLSSKLHNVLQGSRLQRRVRVRSLTAVLRQSIWPPLCSKANDIR